MDRVSRRTFLAAGAGVAAGAAAVALPWSAATASGSETEAGSNAPIDPGVSDLVVHVRDAGRGEVVIFGPDTEVVLNDRKLVAAVARAARKGV